MRIELVPGSVRRLVNVKRDSDPMPGERSPTAIAVVEYSAGWVGTWPSTVAKTPHVSTARWQQYLIENTPAGDRLLAILMDGPIKPTWRGDVWLIDLDRVQRAR